MFPVEPDIFEQCFGTITAPDQFKATDLSQTWRLWDFQVCTQWGFFMVCFVFCGSTIVAY